jgi:hypothetical protein
MSMRLPKGHFDSVTREKQSKNELYQTLAAGRHADWATLFDFGRGWTYQDFWGILRQKLLESFQNAVLAFYRSSDFFRVDRELQIAQLWIGMSLATKEEVAQMEVRRGWRATNRSVPYAEEIQVAADPSKKCFNEGIQAWVTKDSSGQGCNSIAVDRVDASVGLYTFALSEEQKYHLLQNKVHYGKFQAHQMEDN